jgi:hypothetical protein
MLVQINRHFQDALELYQSNRINQKRKGSFLDYSWLILLSRATSTCSVSKADEISPVDWLSSRA